MYRLTLWEMSRLYRGWASLQEEEADAVDTAQGTGGDRATRRAKRDYRSGKPRDSDMRALQRFQENQRIG